MTRPQSRLVFPLLLLALVGSQTLADEPAKKEEPKTSAAEHARHAEVLAADAAQNAHRGHQHGGHPGGMDMHHDFSDAEKWAKVFDDPTRLEWQKPQDVVNLMEIEVGMEVADIGAGTGYFLGYLAAAVGPEGGVLGLDPEKNMVEFMNKKAATAGWKQVEARVIPFDSPGLHPASTDRILIVDTWHHIENRGAYAKKLAESLREGGAVFVVDFTLDSPVGPRKEHRLAAETVMQELKEGGLDPELLEESLPHQYIVRAKKPGCDCGPQAD